MMHDQDHHRNQFVLSIMSRDRVGIVYEIAHALADLDGDIANIRQSVLSGYFTMILLAAFPDDVDQRAIERKLAEVDARSDTAIESVAVPVSDAHLNEPPDGPPPENSYVLTASGPDRIGFVATVADFCRQHAINILDLSTTVNDGQYVMILLVDLSRSGPVAAVRADLADLAAAEGLTVVLQHHDIFRATNEVA